MSMESSCPFCGVIDKGHCRSAEQAEDCPQAPPEGKSPVVLSGPLRGLRRRHYGLIECDPPWGYKTFSNRDRGTVPHRAGEAPYESMTLDELKALPTGELAAEDCLLHMWTISSHFDQAIDLGRSWGFTFRSLGLNWVKTQKSNPDEPKMGMGKWFRQDSEVALLFGRGKPKRLSAGVRQTILEPKREHSRKPDVRLERLEALAAGPYLEMFSRSSRAGWDAMGDEVGKFDPMPELDEEALSLI